VDPNHLSFGLAFEAGLVSFLSPCMLSLVPAYVGYLGSRVIATYMDEVFVTFWQRLTRGGP
jgi:cytochrome c biogenesis protein CcdA